jgi:hypothetical protein
MQFSHLVFNQKNNQHQIMTPSAQMSRHGCMSFLDDGIGLPSINKSKIAYLKKRKNRKIKD